MFYYSFCNFVLLPEMHISTISSFLQITHFLYLQKCNRWKLCLYVTDGAADKLDKPDGDTVQSIVAKAMVITNTDEIFL